MTDITDPVDHGGRTALDLVLSQPWCITPEALETILAVAMRQTDPEAVALKLGRPLRNTRTVEMRDGVAVVPVMGPIFRRANLFTEVSGATSVEVLATDLQAALDDPAVTGIVLNIDSPGGQANGIAELAQVIYDARQRKPITAYVGGTGASAAYWIASAATEMVIDPTAFVGSIGTVAGMRVDNDPKRIEIVSSLSPRKRVDPSTEDGQREIRALLDDVTQVFVDAVARNRGVDSETVLQQFGQGGLLVGERAVKVGMADRIGSFESVIAGLSGASQRGNSMSTTSNAPEITRDLIAENHPDIAEALRAEGMQAAQQGHEAALASARTDAATAERERIQGVLALGLPGHRELLQRLAFDGSTTPEAAAVQVLKAEQSARTKRGTDLGADGSELAASLRGIDGGEEGTGDDVTTAGEDFLALVDAKVAGGMKRGEAVKAVTRENPKAHQAYIARVNGTQAA